MPDVVGNNVVNDSVLRYCNAKVALFIFIEVLNYTLGRYL